MFVANYQFSLHPAWLCVKLGRLSFLVEQFAVGAVTKLQQVEEGLLPTASRVVQCAVALKIDSIDIGIRLNQRRDDLGMSEKGRAVKWCVPVTVRAAGICAHLQ